MKSLDYSEVVVHVARKIREIRKSQDMTVQELAYRCEMERSNMSRIESGRVNITIKTLVLIATALNVKINMFFED